MLVVRLDNGWEQKWSFGGSILSTPPQLCFSSSLLSSSDPLLSPPSLPQRQSTQWGRLADQGEREGGMAANSGVRWVGWSASQVAFDPIMPLVVMVHKQMAALGHIEKMNSDIQGHKIAFVCQPIQPSRVYECLPRLFPP